MRMLALWCHPRARSTAVGRMFYERGDFLVKDEPFARSYYFGSDRISPRRPDVSPKAEYAFEAVLDTLVRTAAERPLFVKDHAYHVASHLSPEFLRHFHNTFLVRHPAQSLPSLHARMPDFSLQETGYEDLYRLFEMARQLTGATPVVICADDLVAQPSATIQAYCEAVGVAFVPQALHWKAGVPDGLEAYWWGDASWHAQLEKSTGFSSQADPGYAGVEDDPKMRRAYEECLPFYLELHERRLRIPAVAT